MAKKGSNGPGKLEVLLRWKKRPFLDKMLDDGISPNQCAKWCQENGFKVSVPTIYNYAKKRKEAIVNDVKIDVMIGSKRKKDADPSKPIDGPPDPVAGHMTQADRAAAYGSVDKVKSDLEMLDAVIGKGFATLKIMDHVHPQIALKAIELKNKITGGSHMGLTTYGIEEIRLREAARETAILTVLLEFIPEDKHEAAIARMEEATKDYYDSIGLGEAYQATTEKEGAVNE